MDKNRLKSVIIEQNAYLRKKDTGFPREALDMITPKLRLKHNIVITGPRRSGKSTLLLQIMRTSLKEDVYHFLRFDDERLLHFNADDFNLLHECFLEIHGERGLFIFDEIQNIKGWERFVNRMYEQGARFLLTGSNANLLSTELSTLLTGRHIDFELYPFSFGEFLRARDFTFAVDDLLVTPRRARLNALFADYLDSGGYPEFLLQGDPQILQALFTDMVTKDIILRHAVRESKAIRELAGYLVSNVATSVSYNALRKTYGLGSSHTVRNYMGYFREVYLFFEVPLFAWSLKRQAVNKRKVYVIDNGLARANGFAFSENTGRRLENLVFLELKRRGLDIYYHKGAHECDFIVKQGTAVTGAIQVAAQLDEKSRPREVRGLCEALDLYKLDEGTILTVDHKEEFKAGGKTIRVIPAPEWILTAHR
ncbi:MAG: ATP-binding protein [Planctomycetota bacterium]